MVWHLTSKVDALPITNTTASSYVGKYLSCLQKQLSYERVLIMKVNLIASWGGILKSFLF